MVPESTKMTERDQWRARILRALAELDTYPPGFDRTRRHDDIEAEGPASNRTT
jgi:hypothetical protein